MRMKTIPIEQLSAYFPYQVKAKFQETNKPTCRKYVIGTVGAIYSDSTIVCHDTVNACPDRFKLMLRPLKTRLNINKDFDYTEIKVLLENHFDIFGLIDAGLAEEIKP